MRMSDIRRLFANTPSETQVLTINGLTYDSVHYRHNPDGTAELINNNHRFTPFADRIDEDGKIRVHIRCWDFDIDMIEVLDETTGEYHPMYSTDPEYTGGLSRWEHHLYRDYLKADGRGSARQAGRVAAKAKRDVLRNFDDELAKMGMRERGVAAALIEAEAARQSLIDRNRAKSDAGREG